MRSILLLHLIQRILAGNLLSCFFSNASAKLLSVDIVSNVRFELSLIDLVSPYVLQGDTLEAWHAVRAALRVSEYEIGQL